MMRKATLLISLTLAAAVAAAEGPLPNHPRFPAGSYDYYGYAPWGSFSRLSPTSTKLLALLKQGKRSGAFESLKKAWILDPKNLDILQGFAESARRSGKLDEALNVVATEARRTTSPQSKFPAHFTLAFQYVLGVRAYEVSENESGFKYPASLKTGAAEFYYGRLYDDETALDEQNPTAVMMYVSSLWARGEIGRTRRVARRVLVKSPRFYQLRLFLSATLDQGVYEQWRGNQKVEVLEDERSNPVLGLKEAETVLRQFPDAIQAYYLAGIYARTIDPGKARAYLTHFLDKSKPGTSRYIRAQHFLEQLNRKRTPL